MLFDAWETKYADDNLRAAAIDRLERLCVSKFHLKVPTIISKKVSTAVSSGNEGSSASGARLDQVKAEEKPRHLVKKKGPVVADVSMLKGPTGVSAATFKTNDSVCPGPSDNHPDTIQLKALKGKKACQSIPSLLEFLVWALPQVPNLTIGTSA